jgi:hypothetical protein
MFPSVIVPSSQMMFLSESAASLIGDKWIIAKCQDIVFRATSCSESGLFRATRGLPQVAARAEPQLASSTACVPPISPTP